MRERENETVRARERKPRKADDLSKNKIQFLIQSMPLVIQNWGAKNIYHYMCCAGSLYKKDLIYMNVSQERPGAVSYAILPPDGPRSRIRGPSTPGARGQFNACELGYIYHQWRFKLDTGI